MRWTLILSLTAGVLGGAEGDAPGEYKMLFDGESFTGWIVPEKNNIGTWSVDPAGGVLKREVRGSMIWTEAQYQDFVLELDFKLSRNANSGLFFRADPSDHVQRGFEIQLFDTAPDQPLTKHNIGALYDAQAAAKNTLNPPREWNHLKLRAKGSSIRVWVNGELVNEVDLTRWTEPELNPDGTPNKFKRALSTLPSSGHIGLQDHGDNVWFRNIRLKEF